MMAAPLAPHRTSGSCSRRAWAAHAHPPSSLHWMHHTPKCKLNCSSTRAHEPALRCAAAATTITVTPETSLQWQERTALLLGHASLTKLHQSRVLVVGLGGVGSFAAEFLARAGVGSLTIVDGDVVDLSNTNRQLPASHSTVGRPKVEIMSARLKDIAPTMILDAKQEFILPETADVLLSRGALGQDGHLGPFDWVVDAIDSLEPKKLLIASAHAAGIPIISSMGAGGRLDASRVRVVRLSSTYNDPFAMNIRKHLRRRGVDLHQVPCVWSDEPVNPRSLQTSAPGTKFKRSYHGTISFLPAQFGLLAAAHVINMLVDGPMATAYKGTPTETWEDRMKRQVAEKRAQKRLRQAQQAQASLRATDNGVVTQSQLVNASHQGATPRLEQQQPGGSQAHHSMHSTAPRVQQLVQPWPQHSSSVTMHLPEVLFTADQLRHIRAPPAAVSDLRAGHQGADSHAINQQTPTPKQASFLDVALQDGAFDNSGFGI